MRRFTRAAVHQRVTGLDDDTGTRTWSDLALAFLVTGIALIAAAGYYVRPTDRSLLVEATTQSILVEFTTDATWRIGEAEVCRIPETRRRTSTAQSQVGSDGPCGVNESVGSAVGTATWQAGARISVERVGYDRPLIRVVQSNGSTARHGEDLIEFMDGDVIQLQDQFGPFRSIGKMRVGGAANSDPILLSGVFEWRETLWLRDRPELIGSGELRSGDIVRVGTRECEPNSEISEAALIFPSQSETAGLQAVLSAVQDREAMAEDDDPLGMCLTRFGFDTTFVVPRLSDRVFSDPLTYALGLLLTLAITLFPAMLGLLDTRRATKAKSPDVAETTPEKTAGTVHDGSEEAVERPGDAGEEPGSARTRSRLPEG